MHAQDSRVCLLGSIGRSVMNQKMKKGVVGGRNGSPQAGLSRILRLFREEEKCLLQQVFGEGHQLHPARILEMGKIGGEVKVGLTSPTVEGLKFVNQRGSHSSRDGGEPGCLGCVGSE
jgi:hypothetical protein